LAADKLLLQSRIRQNAIQLKEKEFMLHNENFGVVRSPSSLTCSFGLASSTFVRKVISVDLLNNFPSSTTEAGLPATIRMWFRELPASPNPSVLHGPRKIAPFATHGRPPGVVAQTQN
jgi:hypothetical protein